MDAGVPRSSFSTRNKIGSNPLKSIVKTTDAIYVALAAHLKGTAFYLEWLMLVGSKNKAFVCKVENWPACCIDKAEVARTKNDWTCFWWWCSKAGWHHHSCLDHSKRYRQAHVCLCINRHFLSLKHLMAPPGWGANLLLQPVRLNEEDNLSNHTQHMLLIFHSSCFPATFPLILFNKHMHLSCSKQKSIHSCLLYQVLGIRNLALSVLA